jgi:hypothetical protein
MKYMKTTSKMPNKQIRMTLYRKLRIRRKRKLRELSLEEAVEAAEEEETIKAEEDIREGIVTKEKERESNTKKKQSITREEVEGKAAITKTITGIETKNLI